LFISGVQAAIAAGLSVLVLGGARQIKAMKKVSAKRCPGLGF